MTEHLTSAQVLDWRRRSVTPAELLGAGIAKALLGKAAVPDDLPFVTGSVGMLGTQPSWEMMDRWEVPDRTEAHQVEWLARR